MRHGRPETGLRALTLVRGTLLAGIELYIC
jgi:hypothetical protein